MAKLTRATQKIFAGSATNNGVFGSLQAGSGQYSNDVETIQSLPAYTQGWKSATISSELLPPLEELQGVQYVNSYQLAYMFQEGVPEWDSETTYYQGSVVKVYSSSGTFLYSSITNDNIGNDPTTSTSNWVQFGSLPDQTGNSGKFLTTNGSQASWGDAATTDLSNITAEAKDLIAGLGMPSTQYIELDNITNGAMHTSPANGFFALSAQASQTNAGGTIALLNTTKNIISKIMGLVSGNSNGVFVPAGKNDVVQVGIGGSFNTKVLRFIYAEGSKE